MPCNRSITRAPYPSVPFFVAITFCGKDIVGVAVRLLRAVVGILDRPTRTIFFTFFFRFVIQSIYTGPTERWFIILPSIGLIRSGGLGARDTDRKK
jgi:hypothetical protein